MTSKYSKEQVRNLYGGRVENLGTPIIPRSRRLWQKGDITDDSVLTFLVADSLIACRGFNRTDICRRLIQCEDPRGGRQIYKLKDSQNPDFVAIDGSTNGSAIRIAGISIVYFDSPLLYPHIIDSCTLTHSERESILGSLLVGYTYGEIMKGRSGELIKENLLQNLHELGKAYHLEISGSQLIKNLAFALILSRKLTQRLNS